jgi:hypothetical protein
MAHTFTAEQVTATMEQRSLTRKAALQFLTRQAKAAAPAAPAATPTPAPKAPKKPKATKKATATAKKKATTDGWDSNKVVALYRAGQKVVDIAVEMGYKRGTGQNRVANALVAAGIYKGSRA